MFKSLKNLTPIITEQREQVLLVILLKLQAMLVLLVTLVQVQLELLL